MALDFDLFGDPVPDGYFDERKPGRPEHEPTPEKRNKVMVLLGMGWTVARVANALGVTQPTLRKHYFHELKFRDEMQDRVKAVTLAKLFELAGAGNVAAIKELGKQIDKEALNQAGAILRAGQAKGKRKKLGKKEQARHDAHSAHEGTDWASLLPSSSEQIN